MATETEKILNTISGLQNGDVVCIQVAGDEMHDGWEDRFQVCGVSANYILAFHDDEYTIINKLPTEYEHNGIPKGSCVCAPDNLIFGYHEGYHFTDPAWAKRTSCRGMNGWEVLTMREKLIELLDKVHHTDMGKTYQERICSIADYLIANGVTIPVPCKECEHWHEETGWCNKHSHFVDRLGDFCYPEESGDWKEFEADYFCKDGERKDQ